MRLIGPENVERAGYGFITHFVLIVVAARIAPNGKLAIAVILSLLIVGGLGAAWLAFPFDVIPTLVANSLTLAAILVALKYAR